ncbi:UNVERIFIED_CONTAM: Vacuolar protein sorting-associated protein 60.2 [Sesamum calycinum]|uniref:Vacuolar protein sorting-associated protein 60.2 n=2 Tax=Sesamum TaxID=4181 RepID=A0AAW2LUH1_9LAMI
MSALKSANKELKGMMKTVKIQDIDNLQDEMMDLMDVSNEIQESLGRSYNVPDDIDEDELMGELDALEADMGFETEGDGVPSYLQPDREPDLESELSLPSAPTGHAPVPAGRTNVQAEDELGLPAVPRASLRGLTGDEHAWDDILYKSRYHEHQYSKHMVLIAQSCDSFILFVVCELRGG